MVNLVDVPEIGISTGHSGITKDNVVVVALEVSVVNDTGGHYLEILTNVYVFEISPVVGIKAPITGFVLISHKAVPFPVLTMNSDHVENRSTET